MGMALTFQFGEGIRMNVATMLVERNGNTKTNGSLGSGNSNDKEGESLTAQGFQIMAHGHQIQIHRIQHEFCGQQHHDEITAGQKAAHTNTEEGSGKPHIQCKEIMDVSPSAAR